MQICTNTFEQVTGGIILDINTLYQPDIVDFIIRKDAYNERMILEHPGLITSFTVRDTYVIGYARLEDYNRIVLFMGRDYNSTIPNVLGPTLRSALESSGIIQVQQQPYLDLRGNGVLMGFVDTGIDYTQEAFKYSDGTSRIKYIYDQSIPGVPPGDFPLGTEYTQEQINSALRSDTPYDIVPHRDVAGHGTFLASIAAGGITDSFVGSAPESEIIMVKLNKAYPFFLEIYAVPPDQENAFESTNLMLGIEYILQKAKALNRPVVICIGLGSNYDSHDGFGHLEDYIMNVSNIPGVCICVSAGNESQSRHHYFNKFNKDRTPENIDIKVGENAGDIFVAITNSISDLTSVSIRSPTGELVGRIAARASQTTITQLVLERSRVSVSYYFPMLGSGDQLTVVKILNATPGIWTITVFGDIVIDGTIRAWLPLTGFVSPEVEFLSSYPYNTIVYPATGVGPICCGAFNSIRNSLYPPSSWGPTRLADDAPDLLAPGYNIEGIFPWGYGTMSGTSIATAITSGACALLMQWAIVKGNDLGFCTPTMKAYLIRGCNRSDVMRYPNPQWGYGTLNLTQTFYYMREL